MTRLRIDRLEVRTKGVAETEVRAALARLPRALLAALAARDGRAPATRLPAGAGAQAVAESLAAALAERIAAERSRGRRR